MLEDEDFEDDEVDAGEVGALHNVTALYELQLNEDADDDASIVELRLRWKSAESFGVDESNIEVSQLNKFCYEKEVKESYEKASPYYRLALNIAEFAEILRASPYVEGNTIETVIGNTKNALSDRCYFGL